MHGLVQGTDEEWGENQPLVDQLRAALLKDCGDKFSWINESPPIRGPHCEARIHLKLGAQAKAQRQIWQQGEKLQDMKEIAEGWVAKGRAEPYSSNWRHPSFPVKKKDGKWRGVIDLKRLNSQCEDEAYPLPRIEDLLVKQLKLLASR